MGVLDSDRRKVISHLYMPSDIAVLLNAYRMGAITASDIREVISRQEPRQWDKWLSICEIEIRD